MDKKKQDVNIDFLINEKGGSINASGPVAKRLLANNFNVNALRTNDTLLYDEWKEIDKVVLKAAQERLVVVGDLRARGLTYDVPGGLGKTVLAFQDMSDITGAEVNMDGISRGRRDRPEYGITYLPLPIVHKDFSFTAREIAASRNGTMPLDTSMAELAGRKVSEMIETITFQGLSSYAFGGGVIYGLEDYPSAVSGSLTGAWDGSAQDGPDICADVRTMKQALIAKKMYGPYGLYIPTDYETKMDADYVVNYPKTIRARALETENVEFIKVADHMTSSKVIMLQLTSDVMRMVIGLDIVTVEWDSEGGLLHNFKVMAIMVPQPRKTQEDDCGICVYSE